MKTIRIVAIWAVVLCLLYACGGDSSSGTTPAPNVVQEGFEYIVGRSQTVRIGSNTVIIADYIQIDGQILVAPNTSLWLLSLGQLYLYGTGSIGPDPAFAARPPGFFAWGGPRAAYAQSGSPTGGPLVALAGVAIGLYGPVTAPVGPANGPGGHVHLITFEDDENNFETDVNLEITSVITGGAGRDGDADAPNAGRGGDVTLASAEGEVAVRDAFASSNTIRPPFGLTNLRLTGVIRGGAGGRGWSDTSGRTEGGTLICAGGLGGDGGNVYLLGQNARAGGALIEGGDGGNGGDAGSPDARAQSGTAAGEAGLPFVGRSGSGGSGGRGEFASSVLQLTGTPTQYGGRPGVAGSVIGAAGQGGPGGPGGSFTAMVGLRGQDGLPVPRSPQTGRPTVQVLGDSGRGGDSTFAGLAGGAGGSLLLDLFSEADITLFAGSLSGGAGFDGNGVPGTNGGNGGTLTYGRDIRSPFVANSAANGGDGGDGFPTAGVGGAAGVTDAGTPIGVPGADGVVTP